MRDICRRDATCMCWPMASSCRPAWKTTAMMVLISATAEGKTELIGFEVGVRDSTQSWREVLIDVKQRGLQIATEIAVGDGALGF
jgi:putative transposase